MASSMWDYRCMETSETQRVTEGIGCWIITTEDGTVLNDPATGTPIAFGSLESAARFIAA